LRAGGSCSMHSAQEQINALIQARKGLRIGALPPRRGGLRIFVLRRENRHESQLGIYLRHNRFLPTTARGIAIN
jgi:hypothetical protein